MYTQCPACREAFRVTAEILQQAAGRVRCGTCGHVFDALDGLSEGPPAATERTPADERAFREAMDELDAAGEIRIEDTGVEWRVVEDERGPDEAGDGDAKDASALRWYIQDPADEPGNDAMIPEAGLAERQESLELGAPADAEQRYDDNSPLPGLLEDEEDDDAPSPAPAPRRRAEDFIEPPSAEFDERQVDLALGEPEEWTVLLEEVTGTNEPAPLRERAVAPGSYAEDEPTSEHPALEVDELTLAEDEAAAELELATDGDAAPGRAAAQEPEPAGDDAREALRFGDENGGEALELLDVNDEPALELVVEGEVAIDDATGELAALEASPGGADDAPPDTAVTPRDTGEDEKEDAIDRLIDEELLRATGSGQDLAATGSGAGGLPAHVETIVMEGEFITSSLHGEAPAPAVGDETPSPEADALKDTYVRSRAAVHAYRQALDPRRYAGSAAVALLVLLLAAQLVHAHREKLATYDAFGGTIGAVYRRLGAPITPDWDVNGWQFESTRGSTDANDSILTISSRITNRSSRPLPYPLLHVTLTDRYEEVVAGALLEPGRYLAIRSAEGTVEPGERLNATVTISPLSADAAGFKLNVCYPLPGTRVRCATGAFKND